ncbi:MAG: DEAD/DEAH box helicase [bacterium]|nr:DEAD/DEAH box helicase [bacterium]
MDLRIEFDRGTLLCFATPAASPHRLPGMRWDARVDCYRAPARYYGPILEQLQAEGIVADDAVRVAVPPFRFSSTPALRPYQAAALDAWRLARGRGIVSLPTGSGKTYVAAAAIAEYRRGALCLVPTKILLDQWHGMLSRLLGGTVGRYGDGSHDVLPVTVATFESAWRQMHQLGNRFDLLIVDEVHHFGSGLRDEALEMSAARWRMGLTATPPDCDAESALIELIGPVVFKLSIADLAGGYLSGFELIELRSELTQEEREEYEVARRTFAGVSDHFRSLAPEASWSDFMRWAARTPQGRDAIAAWHRARRVLSLTDAKNRMLGSLLDRHRGSRVLVFTADKQSSYRISLAHLIMPITADIKRRERDDMLSAFQQGTIRALVSARVLNEGFDVPAADVGIIVSGSLGEREHTQRVGRLLRPAPGKSAVIYELVSEGTSDVPQARRKRRGLE